MRRLENYVRTYGPEAGPKLYHALQSQAAHPGVSVRLRCEIDALLGQPVPPRPTANAVPAPFLRGLEFDAESAVGPIADLQTAGS
jgi:hypothetical protein